MSAWAKYLGGDLFRYRTLLGGFQICWDEQGAGGGVLPPPNMWISHLSGKRLCMTVNNSRGVSPHCSPFSSLHLSITRLCKLNTFLFASSLLPLHCFQIQCDPPTLSATPAAPLICHLPYSSPHLDAHTRANEQMAPKLKRAVQEHQSKHQPQIPQTNMWVRRPNSSVTGSMFAFPPGMSSSSPPLLFY